MASDTRWFLTCSTQTTLDQYGLRVQYSVSTHFVQFVINISDLLLNFVSILVQVLVRPDCFREIESLSLESASFLTV